VANGSSATGYGLAIDDEKDKSSMGFKIGTLRICKWEFRFILKVSPLFTYAVKNDTGIR
jgi:hypothetical protein